jgi:hypothetical protein
MPFVGESTGDANAKLFMRGVREGYNGERLGASDMPRRVR